MYLKSKDVFKMIAKVIFFALGAILLFYSVQMYRSNKQVFATVKNAFCNEMKCSAVLKYKIDKDYEVELETGKTVKGDILQLEYSQDSPDKATLCCVKLRSFQLAFAIGIIFLYMAYSGKGV